MAAEGLRIGDLARATSTKVETIRYYEQIGLLPTPSRTGGNFRAYAPEHLGRLSFIRRARDLGFTVDEVRELLGLSDQKHRSCKAVDTIAREHLADVDRKIAGLKALRAELSSIINQCGCGTIAECRIIEALAPPSRGQQRIAIDRPRGTDLPKIMPTVAGAARAKPSRR